MASKEFTQRVKGYADRQSYPERRVSILTRDTPSGSLTLKGV
jgi:hypothetical protein